MLLGRTELMLSHATVRQALQEYFERTFAPGHAPVISEVRTPGYTVEEFQIICEGTPHSGNGAPPEKT